VWRTSQRQRELQVELYVTVFAMRSRSPAARASWLLATALQLLLPGAAAWADARLDAAGTHATAHIESHTAKSCARIHAPDCAICHFLTAPAVTGRALLLRLDVAARQAPRPVDPAGTAHPLARPHPQPRAPPALS
jgi:hypothetical protein